MIATGLVRALEQDLGRLRNAAVAFDIAVESDMGLKTRDMLYRNTILSLSHLFITAGVAVGGRRPFGRGGRDLRRPHGQGEERVAPASVPGDGVRTA